MVEVVMGLAVLGTDQRSVLLVGLMALALSE